MGTFKSDYYIFNNDIDALIKNKEKNVILKVINDKHIEEIINNIDILDKKNGLIIWNAIYVKEIIKEGISKKYLHPIYNDFYNIIQNTDKLKDLQKLEINMAICYLDFLIKDVQVTENFILNKILKVIHVSIENHIHAKDIAKAVNISEGYAFNLFKKYMGISLMEYVRKLKIERGKVLLLRTTKSILDISIILGFYDQSHFTKVFKKIVGITPTEYRNTHYF